MNVKQPTWTIEDLRAELRRWEQELVAEGLRPATIETYIGRSEQFIRWLAGERQPHGPRHP